MSTRHVRKILGSTALPPPDENSDDDFVPLYTKKQTTKGAYAALELDSTPDPEPDSEIEIIEDEQPKSSNEEKKKKRNNRKNKKAKSTNSFNLDEIDKSVREVNALLGEPSPPMETQKNEPDPEALLFSVQQKYLDSNNEMTRIFGPEDDEDEIRRQRQRNIKFQKNIVIPKVYAFNKLGLSMSLKCRENDVTYFTFDHNKEYRAIHQTFLETVQRLRAAGVMAPIEDLLSIMHIEGLLESADVCFRMEEYTSANEIIEQCIAYMQYVAHPCFSLTGRRSRLEYRYLENRAFHVALLKYVYLLTSRACHRTALEVGKALLNLDPSDPLAAILVLDALALRAREHRWLRAAAARWAAARGGRFLFNLQYSRAACCFHLARAKDREVDIEEANESLQEALLKFPYVLIKLVECCNQSVPEKIRKSHFFNEFATVSTPQPLKDLMWLYIKMTWARWREPAVLDWLLTNARTVVDNFERNIMDQKSAMAEVQKHSQLFQKWPEEIIRHLCIIKPMSNLLVDGAVPDVPSYPLNSNPCPPHNTINRYNYVLQRRSDMDFVPALLRTIQPYYNDDEQN